MRRDRRRLACFCVDSFVTHCRRLGEVYYFDTSYGATDDGTTSTWVDRIGGEQVTSTSTATRLVYSTSLAGLGGRPGWTATRANSTRLTNASSALAERLDGSSPLTIMSVRKAASLSEHGAVLGLGGTLGQISDLYVAQTNGNAVFERYDGGYYALPSTANSGTALVVDTVTYDGTSAAAHYTSGVASGSGTTAIAPTCNAFTIGSRDLGTNNFDTFFDGLIGDIILFPRALGATERRGVEAMLMTKYGIA